MPRDGDLILGLEATELCADGRAEGAALEASAAAVDGDDEYVVRGGEPVVPRQSVR